MVRRLSSTGNSVTCLCQDFFRGSLVLSRLGTSVLHFRSTGSECTELRRRFPRVAEETPLAVVTSCLRVALRALDEMHTSVTGTRDGWDGLAVEAWLASGANRSVTS